MVAAAEDAPPVIPGTGTEMPAYDPETGGWSTEQAAEAISAQLKRLSGLASHGEAVTAEAMRSLVTSSARLESLRPAELSTVYAVEPLGVRRLESPSLEALPAGVDGAATAIRSIRDLLAAGDETKAKAKVTGIELDDEDAQASVEFHLEGPRSAGGRVQVNAKWVTAWDVSGERPLLKSLRLADYEEVVSESTDRPFHDLTAAVLGDDPAFQSQLVYGVDHWLARLDMRTGIQVGGWNGLAIGDANGDGRDDVYICQSGGLPNRLFIQQEDGRAVDVAAKAGVDWLETSRAALFIDLDNDGDQDLVTAVVEGLIIQENDGTGVFTVRGAEILPDANPYTLAAADYDQDGRLDLYAACYDRRGHVDRNLSLARPVPYHDANNGGRNVLLRNEGNFTFRHVTKQVGLDVNNERYSYAAAWADYDRDGDLDLYVANDFGRNNLYRQDRDASGRPQFADVAEASGVLDIAAGMSATWGDINNDGWLDLYVSNMFSSAGNRIVTQQRFLPEASPVTRNLFLRHARGNSLFENPGSGPFVFEDVSVASAVTQGRWAWGSVVADLNNDGWQDIVVANGFITQEDTGDL